MRIFLSRALLILLLLCPLPAAAEDLYVRHGLATGDDDGSSYDNAWQGVENVVWDEDAGDDAGEVGAGDTLYMCGGPYDDRLVVAAAGTPTAWITIDGNCAALDASYTNGTIGRIAPANATTDLGQIISLFDDEYIIVQNLTFDDIFGVKDRRLISNRAQPDGIMDGAPSATVMTDSGESWTVGDLVGGIIFNRTDDPDSYGIITANDATTITVASLTGGTANTWATNDEYAILDDDGAIRMYGDTHHIKIRWNTFNIDDTNVGFAIMGYLGGGMLLHDIEITGNHFSGKDDEAIFFPHVAPGGSALGQAYNILINNNTSEDIYRLFYSMCVSAQALDIDADGDGSDDDDLAPYNIDIIGNQIEIATGGYQAVGYNAGTRPVPGDDYNEFSGNTITTVGTQIPSSNIIQTHWNRDLVIENNTIEGPSLTSGCDGCAIIGDWIWTSGSYYSRDVIIRNNIIHGADSNGCDGKGISIYRGSDFQVYNNLLYNNDIGIKVGSFSSNVSNNNLIYNNTIYNSEDDGILVSNAVGSPTNTEIKNNIIDTAGGDGIDDDTNNVGDADEAYNLVNNITGNDCEGTYGGRTDNTCGAGTLIDQAPVYRNASGGDFRPKLNSPTVDAGTSVGLTTRCGTGYDIGGHEAPSSPMPLPILLIAEACVGTTSLGAKSIPAQVEYVTAPAGGSAMLWNNGDTMLWNNGDRMLWN